MCHAIKVNDVNVFERPKFLTEKPNCTDHSIIVSSTEDIEEKVVIPLALQGVTSFFHTRKPTLRELEVAEKEGRVFDLTVQNPWHRAWSGTGGLELKLLSAPSNQPLRGSYEQLLTPACHEDSEQMIVN